MCSFSVLLICFFMLCLSCVCLFWCIFFCVPNSYKQRTAKDCLRHVYLPSENQHQVEHSSAIHLFLPWVCLNNNVCLHQMIDSFLPLAYNIHNKRYIDFADTTICDPSLWHKYSWDWHFFSSVKDGKYETGQCSKQQNFELES